MTVLAESTTCRVSNFQIVTGYHFNVTGGSPTGAILADTLRRSTRFYINFANNVSDGETDPVTSAVVSFGDLGPGPVSSVGQVIQETGSQRVEVTLPREDFEAFWHALRDVHDFVAISWNENREVVEFSAWGYERMAGDEESRKRTDKLREELRAEVAS